MSATEIPVPAADNFKMKQINLRRIVFEYENGRNIAIEGKDLQEWLLSLANLNHELSLLQNRNI